MQSQQYYFRTWINLLRRSCVQELHYHIWRKQYTILPILFILDSQCKNCLFFQICIYYSIVVFFAFFIFRELFQKSSCISRNKYYHVYLVGVRKTRDCILCSCHGMCKHTWDLFSARVIKCIRDKKTFLGSIWHCGRLS